MKVPRWGSLVARTRLLLIAAGALAIASGAVVAAGLQSTWSTDPPSPAAGGKDVLSAAVAAPGLKLVAVSSSAFSTTIELRLTPIHPLGAEDTIAIERRAIRVNPEMQEVRLEGVRRVSAEEVALLIATGPLKPGTTQLGVSIDEYVIVPASGDGIPVSGPWTVTGATAPSRPEAVTSAKAQGGIFSADAGGGLRFVVDDAAYDGYVLRLGYHVEGDIADILMFASPPAQENAIALPLLGPAPGVRQVVDVRLETNSPSVQIVFPRLVRVVKQPVDATLTRNSGTAFTGATDAGDTPLALRVEPGGAGAFSIVLTSLPGTGLGFTSSVSSVQLTDDLANTYSLTGVSGKAADGGGAASALHFSGSIPPGAGQLDLRFIGYELALGEPARISLPLR